MIAITTNNGKLYGIDNEARKSSMLRKPNVKSGLVIDA